MKYLDVTVISQEKISEDYYHLVMKSDGSFGKILPGQFIMLGFPGSLDPVLPRPMGFYQIIKNEKDFTEFSIGYIVVGKGTKLLSMLRTGDRLKGTGPLGNGWSLEETNRKSLMVAGGIGITPFYMLAQELKNRGNLPILLYGAKTNEDLIFLNDFKELGIETILYTEDGSAGAKGLVSEGLTEYLSENTNVYTCGPLGMLAAVARICLPLGVDPQLSFDRRMACGFGVCLGCNLPVKNAEGIVKNVRVCKEGPVFKGSEVIW